jgi:hypothetical protein
MRQELQRQTPSAVVEHEALSQMIEHVRILDHLTVPARHDAGILTGALLRVPTEAYSCGENRDRRGDD